MNKGIYIHAPFCVSKCPYCDFYSAPACEGERRAYAESVIRAVESAPFEFIADTLFIGGGTPSLLPVDSLIGILDACRRRFGLENAECTIEANPGTVDIDKLKALFDGGFNRISFGVQETHARHLKTLGRIHSFEQAKDAILSAHKAGFRRISADLMLAIPSQTENDIRESVRTLSSLPIDHLSAYMLQIEEGTPFFERVKEPSDEFYAECYRAAVNEAEKCGMHQYEISNFARSESSQSRHNLHYWRCEEYLGIGPSAHSFLNGERFYFEADRDKFVSASDPWALIVSDGEGGDEEERIMLGLRLKEGICPDAFSAKTAERLIKKSAPYIKAELMEYKNGRLSLTREGFLLSNAIIAEMI